MATQTGLDYLRTRTVVDCDTLDEEGIYTSPAIIIKTTC